MSHTPLPVFKAAEALSRSLQTPGPARCMGCDQKKSPAGFSVLTYHPKNPAHHPIAYLVCPQCFVSKNQMKKAILGIETISRARAEGAL